MPRTLTPLLLTLLVAVLLAPGDPVRAEDAPPSWLLHGATVHRGDGTVGPASVLIRDGKIVAVGPEIEAKDARRVDVTGLTLIPGLIDARSALLVRANERSAGRASYRIADAIDPFDRQAREAVEGGVTTVLVAPGGSSTWGGRSAVCKLTDPVRVLDVDPGILVTVGVTRGKNRPTGLTVRGEWGGVYGMLNRGKSWIAARKKYRDDRAKHAKALEAWKKAADAAKAKKTDPPKRPADPKPPKPDPDGIALAALAKGLAPLRAEVHGAAGIRTALAVARRAGVHLVLTGCTGLAAAAGEIPESVPVVLAASPWGGPPEAKPDPKDAVALHEAGVPFAIASFGPSGRRSRHLLDLAALCVRAGLPREAALRALTGDAARAVGLSGKTGRIAPGLAADLVALDGDPFSSATRVRWVMIEGDVVHGEDPR